MCAVNQCQNIPTCSTLQCTPNYFAVKGTTKSLTITDATGNVDPNLTIINIQTEIMKNGPVVACMFVPWDIYGPQGTNTGWHTTDGVYINGSYEAELTQEYGSAQGISGMPANSQYGDLILEGGAPAGHALSIVGWGTQMVSSLNQEIPYWLVRNSWGNTWNGNGFFKYAMYNASLNINTKLGLDVPVMNSGQLFGGATSFMPDLNTGNPVVKASSSSSVHINWINIGKIAGYSIAGLIGLAILYYLFKKFKVWINKPVDLNQAPSPPLPQKTQQFNTYMTEYSPPIG